MTTLCSTGRLAFGDFELDLSSGDLTRRGRPVRLAAQPIKVLMLLVRRPGELVPRGDIRQHVWGDTVVEHDQGLNACVRQIRSALGDRPDPPVFIETVPRRGYRFIAPVKLLDEEARRPARLGRRILQALAVAAVLLALSPVALRFPTEPPEGGDTALPARQRAMLVVLPFDSYSPEPADVTFGRGLTEELITELALLGPERLGVISRTSAMHYEGQSPSLEQLGRELGVDYVLEGSVRRGEGVLRIVAQLVRVSDRSHLWAERFDRPSVDLLNVQLDVARRVAASLVPELLADHSLEPAVEPAAWEAYLRGRYRIDEAEPPDAEKALADFQRALELDPRLAQAHLGISDAYRYIDVPDARERRRRSIEEALRIDPELAAAHLRLGRLQLWFDWDFEAAGRSYARAVELDPGTAENRQAYAIYLSLLRRHDEAVTHMDQALRLDPISIGMHGDGGLVYFVARRYEQAVGVCRRALELVPDQRMARTCLLDAYLQLGRHRLALEQAEALMRLDATEDDLQGVAAAPGVDEALRVFFEWRAAWLEGQQAPVAIAAAVLALGRVDEVFSWLEKAYQQRSTSLLYLAADPRADRFRDDGRYLELLRRIGFPTTTIDS